VSLRRPVRFIKNNSVKSSSPFAGAVLACLGEACPAAPALMFIPYLASGISPKSLGYKYATIKTMKAVLPEPVHESYLRYRKQRSGQIILPVVVAAIVFVSLVIIVLVATFGGNGDVGRWAAVSTVWIAVLTCTLGVVFLALSAGMIYLMGQLLGIAPTYTGRGQDIVHKLANRIRRGGDMAVRPIIALNSFGATIKALLGRK
jgi:hypothetical protein